VARIINCWSLVNVHGILAVVLIEFGMRPIYQFDDISLDAHILANGLALLQSWIRIRTFIEHNLVDVDFYVRLQSGGKESIPHQVVHEARAHVVTQFLRVTA
jgi:hypothetical protein